MNRKLCAYTWTIAASLALSACDGLGSSTNSSSKDIVKEEHVSSGGSATTHITSISGLTGDYGIGDTITIIVEFSDTVTVSGKPLLRLNAITANNTPLYAEFASPAASNKQHLFIYTVSQGDHVGATDNAAFLSYDATNALQLNGGRIFDSVNNTVDISLPSPPASISQIRIDSTPPVILQIAAVAPNTIFTQAGQHVLIEVILSKIVSVESVNGVWPSLALSDGRSARYISGNGSNVLRFDYVTVAYTDHANPLALDATKLSNELLSGGLIYDASFLNTANLSIDQTQAAFDLKTSRVVIETGSPVVSNITLSPQDNCNPCGLNKSIAITLGFSKNVTLSQNASIQLFLNNGGSVVASAPGLTTASTFVVPYSVLANQTTGTNNLAVTNIALSSGTLVDSEFPQINVNLSIIPLIANSVKIDGVAPIVSSVSSAGSFGLGKSAPIAIQFNEEISVTGIPTLNLTLNTSNLQRIASFASQSNTSTMLLNYLVEDGDAALPLASAGTTALVASGGSSIVDRAGNAAVLDLRNISITTQIEARPITVSVSTSRASGTYGTLQEALPITLNFNRSVVASTAGSLTLSVGSNARTIAYDSTQSFSNALALAPYTVQASDDNFAVTPASLSGTWTDQFGNTIASAAFIQWRDANSIIVDGRAPSVIGVSTTATAGTYATGQVIPITVTFSEPVKSSGGNILLTLNVGSPNVTVSTTVSPASRDVSFNYTVASGHNVSNLQINGLALAVGASLSDIDANGTALNRAIVNLGANNLPMGITINTLPQAPSGLSVFSQASQNATNIVDNLAWSAPTDAQRAGFMIWYGTGDVNANTPEQGPAIGVASTTVGPDVRAAQIDARNARTKYNYRIFAYNAANQYSASANVVSSTPRNWNYNGYLKAINQHANDHLGAGLSRSVADLTGGRAVDISSWNYNGTPTMFAVSGAPNYGYSNTGIENSDATYSQSAMRSQSGAVYVYKRSTAAGSAWSHDAILHPNCHSPDGYGFAEVNLFGFSTAVSATTIAVGSPLNTIGGEQLNINGIAANCGQSYWAGGYDYSTGAVYLYRQTNYNNGDANWIQYGYLRTYAFYEYSNIYFGWSVALSNSTVLVGSPNAKGSGGAELFWPEGYSFNGLELVQSGARANDRFGWSVAVDGPTAVVSAPWEDGNCDSNPTSCPNTNATDSGAVYVFSTETGAQQYYLKAPNRMAGTNFGFSVAISRDTIVVGAPYEDSNIRTITLGEFGYAANLSAPDTGAAYVYRQNGTQWKLEAVLKAPIFGNDGAADFQDHFGSSVDITGDTIVVGAEREDRPGGVIYSGTSTDPAAGYNEANAGAAYVFRRTGTSWFRDAYLKPLSNSAHTNTANINFGAGVSIDPLTEAVIVAAPLDSNLPPTGIYRYDFPAGTNSGGNFGMNTNSAGSGAVYIFTP